jgi:DNA-directed RNA polymerase specialized sigma24 family protein
VNAYELVKQRDVTDDGVVPKGKQYVFWLAKRRIQDYHRRCASQRRRPWRVVVEYVPDIDAKRKIRWSRPVGEPESIGREVSIFLEVLSPRAQEVLARKYRLGQSNLDIAGSVGLSTHGVRSLLFRSRRTLETELRTLLDIMEPRDNQPSQQPRST